LSFGSTRKTTRSFAKYPKRSNCGSNVKLGKRFGEKPNKYDYPIDITSTLFEASLLNTRTSRAVILLEIAIILVMIYSLWYRVSLPSVYFAASMLLGIMLAISTLTPGRCRYLVFQALLIFLMIRNVYYVATQYSSMPFADPHWNYGVFATFSETNSIFVIPGETYPAIRLPWYSGWPLLHISALILFRVSSIDSFYITLMLTSIISAGSFIFVYLLIEKVRHALNLSVMVTFLALLIYATSPETIFWDIRFTHQNIGIFLLTAILYFICRSISKPNRKNSILIILSAISLVLAHHFTSFIAVFYLLLFSTFVVAGKYLTVKTKIGANLFRSKRIIVFWNIAVITSAFLFLWWNNFGTVIWPHIGSVLGRVMEIIKGIKGIEPFLTEAYYPESLTPTWVSPLLISRDIILYIPTLFGFLYILKRKTKNPQEFFVLYSLVAFGLLFIVNLLIIYVEPYRIIMLSMPLVSLCTAIFYDKLNKQKHALRMLIAPIIVLMIFSSFVGLWAHRYVPAHLYDPSVNPIDVGEHSTSYLRLKSFFDQYIAYENIDKILADDIFPLYVILPSNAYKKVERIAIENLAGVPMIVELRDQNLYEYYYFRSPPVKPWEAEPLKLKLKYSLETNFNLIYSDGDFRIWYARQPLT
jgi:hypothetical protein